MGDEEITATGIVKSRGNAAGSEAVGIRLHDSSGARGRDMTGNGRIIVPQRRKIDGQNAAGGKVTLVL